MYRSACAVAVLALAATFLGCKQQERPPAFTEAQHLGGVDISAETLNRGHSFFLLHCAACHGANGSGQGPVGITQIPAPRDLRLGVLKYASVPAGSLPTDADLHHLMVTGLNGTGMQPWRFRDEEIAAVTDYVKTLSPRWRNEKPGAPVARPPDPFGGATGGGANAGVDNVGGASADVRDVLARGKATYHGPNANCIACHPAYDPSARQPERPNPSEAVTSDTIFGKLTAPDLAKAQRRVGNDPNDVFQVIAAGVGGTAMAGMDGKLEPQELWALTHYVVSLQPSKR